MTGTGLTIPLDSFRILLPQRREAQLPFQKNIQEMWESDTQTEKTSIESRKCPECTVGRVRRSGEHENCALYDFSEWIEEKMEKISGRGACASVCLSSEDRDVFFSFQNLSDVI